MSWKEQLEHIEQCAYADIVGTEMCTEAENSILGEPFRHVGSGDVWFRHTDNFAFAGLWKPASHKLRFAPLFTRETARGQGIGKALVYRRFQYGKLQDDITKMDTYAYHPDFFYRLGFEHLESFDEGTHHMVYDKD